MGGQVDIFYKREELTLNTHKICCVTYPEGCPPQKCYISVVLSKKYGQPFTVCRAQNHPKMGLGSRSINTEHIYSVAWMDQCIAP